MYAEEEMRRLGEEVRFEREWDGLGFGTGAEEDASDANVSSPVGTRGGRVRWRGTSRAGGGVAAKGVFADGSLDDDDDVFEEAMRTAMEDARRAIPDVRQNRL